MGQLFCNPSAVRIRKATVHALIASMVSTTAMASTAACEIKSGERLTPVLELYTSEGCSSCPPADQWLSTWKGKPVVAQAFHVAYWDYIGWKDPFANPAFTSRQREVAEANSLSGIYTPQLVRNGRDWSNWRPCTRPLPRVGSYASSQRGLRDEINARVKRVRDCPCGIP